MTQNIYGILIGLFILAAIFVFWFVAFQFQPVIYLCAFWTAIKVTDYVVMKLI